VTGNGGIWRDSGKHLRFGGEDREDQWDWERSEKNKHGTAVLQAFYRGWQGLSHLFTAGDGQDAAAALALESGANHFSSLASRSARMSATMWRSKKLRQWPATAVGTWSSPSRCRPCGGRRKGWSSSPKVPTCQVRYRNGIEARLAWLDARSAC
jgi:hypothetical protein